VKRKDQPWHHRAVSVLDLSWHLSRNTTHLHQLRALHLLLVRP
jgi:hypothetical protein